MRRATPFPTTWSCSGRGLPCRSRRREPRWALTPPFHPYPISPLHMLRTWGGIVSVALSVGLPRLGVTQRPALWSPDFPRKDFRPSAIAVSSLPIFHYTTQMGCGSWSPGNAKIGKGTCRRTVKGIQRGSACLRGQATPKSRSDRGAFRRSTGCFGESKRYLRGLLFVDEAAKNPRRE